MDGTQLLRRLNYGWSDEAQLAGEAILKLFIARLNATSGRTALLVSRKTKRVSRVIQKHKQYVADGCSEEEAIKKIRDLAGSRILVCCLRDVNYAHELFCKYIERRKRVCLVDGDCESHSRDTGYRALHQNTLVKLRNSNWFPFEVQFLTFVQHTWDQIQHPVFESPPLYSEELRSGLRALSDEFHRLCQNGDSFVAKIESIPRRIV